MLILYVEKLMIDWTVKEVVTLMESLKLEAFWFVIFYSASKSWGHVTSSVCVHGDDWKFKSKQNIFIKISVRKCYLLPPCLFKLLYMLTQNTSRDSFVAILQGLPLGQVITSISATWIGAPLIVVLVGTEKAISLTSIGQSNILDVLDQCYTRSTSYLLTDYSGKMPFNATWKINGLHK